jgi:hypothetical protein
MLTDSYLKASADLDRHDQTVFGPGDGAEAAGQSASVDDERVVAHRLELPRKAPEKFARFGGDRRDLPVHDARRVPDFSPRVEAQSLMAQADAQDRDFRKRFENFGTDADVLAAGRVPGPGRDDDVVELQVAELFHGERVVLDDHGALAVDLPERLGQDVGVGVVVVDQQGFHSRKGGTRTARSEALN